MPALWAQDMFVTRFADYGPTEYCVQSMIRDDSAVRYLVLIRVSALGETFVTEQRSPDGTELETLEVTLREGDAPTELVADFSHTLVRHGVEKLRFSGTTVLPRRDR